MIKLSVIEGKLEYQGKNEFKLSKEKTNSNFEPYKTISVNVNLETAEASKNLNEELTWKDRLVRDFKLFLDKNFED